MIKLPITMLDRDKINGIVLGCDHTDAGDRDASLITLLYGSGLRISEALNLRVEDIDFQRNTAVVRSGKNKKTRVVAVSQEAIDSISEMITMSGARAKDRLFPVTASAVRKRMSRLARRLGMPRLHAHSIRHAHAVELARRNVPIHYIKEQLGHSNIGTTSLYLERYNPDERVSAVLTALGG